VVVVVVVVVVVGVVVVVVVVGSDETICHWAYNVSEPLDGNVNASPPE
jgi:hypothetical protein